MRLVPAEVILNFRQPYKLTTCFLSSLFIFVFQYSPAQTKLDSLRIKNPAEAAIPKIDSSYSGIQSKINGVKTSGDSATRAALNKVDSIRTAFQSKVDSVQNAYRAPLNKLNEVRHGLQNKIDSLKGSGTRSAKKLTREYGAKLDSINRIQSQKLAEVNQKVEQFKSKAGASLKEVNLPPQMQAPLNNLTQSIQGYKVPVINGSIPNNLPATALPGLFPTLANTQVPGLNISNPQLGGLPNGSNQVSNIANQSGGIGNEVTNLTQQKMNEVKSLDKTAESQVMKTGAVSELQGKSGDANKMMGQLAGRPDSAALKMGEAELMKEATNHFKGQEAVLQSAMGQMSKLKMRYSEVKSVAELPKKLPNPLKQLPFIERIIPGITFQMLNNGQFILDVNPNAVYRITPRFSAGAGWMQRIVFGKGRSHNDRVFGPRAIFQLNWSRGFSFRFQPEVVSAYVPQVAPVPGTNEGDREWVASMYVGMKKEFKVWKRIAGTTEFMYNLADLGIKNPYADRIAARFGFEFPIRKKKVNKKN
jgi:hypothetical protein